MARKTVKISVLIERINDMIRHIARGNAERDKPASEGLGALYTLAESTLFDSGGYKGFGYWSPATGTLFDPASEAKPTSSEEWKTRFVHQYYTGS